MKHFFLSFVAVLSLLTACSKNPPAAVQTAAVPTAPPIVEPARGSIDEYTLTALPEWTVAFQDPGDIRYFDLDKLMKTFKLNRYQAIEIQNGYRDLTRPYGNKPIPREEKEAFFAQALDTVLAQGSFEKSLNVDRIDKAKFVVIFDLDNTLYDKHLKADDTCPKIEFESALTSKPVRIRLAPGWEELVNSIHKMGGTSVLFTAWLDDATRENLEHWDLDGKPILQSEKVSGLLTHSHLSMGLKEKGEEPRAKRSKDIRIVDETLKKAILVDNNPTLVFQFRNLRLVAPFEGADICNPADASQKELYEQSLKTVRAEIEESVLYMQTSGKSFAEAFLPYSELGRLAVEGLMAVPGYTLDSAREKVRTVPTLAKMHY